MNSTPNLSTRFRSLLQTRRSRRMTIPDIMKRKKTTRGTSPST